MKKMFMKLLPVVAAVLLAVSCGKDDDNSPVAVDEETTPSAQPAQEQVEDNETKTIVIRGKVDNGSLSKVTVTEGALAFQVGDEFTFSESVTSSSFGNEVVSGTITITNTDGSYEAVLNYKNVGNLTRTWGYTATHGTNLTTISGAYNSLEDAVGAAYYEIRFQVVQNDDGSFVLRASSDNNSDIKVKVMSAFIRAECSRTIKVGGEDKPIVNGKYYVVPYNVTMGSSTTKTPTAGKVYTVKRLAGSISFEVPFANYDRSSAYFRNSLTNTGTGKVTYSIETVPMTGVATIDAATGDITATGCGRAFVTATVESNDEYNYGVTVAKYELSIVPQGFVDLNTFMEHTDGSATIVLWKDLQQFSSSTAYSSYYAFGEKKDCEITGVPEKKYNRVELRDGLTVEGTKALANSYDAAYAADNRTHMPELADWELLSTQCYWLWNEESGNKGYYVFAAKEDEHKGSMDQKYSSLYDKTKDPCIFLPANGCKSYTSHAGGTSDDPTWTVDHNWVLSIGGSVGYYWSSTVDVRSDGEVRAYYFRLNNYSKEYSVSSWSSEKYPDPDNGRTCGYAFQIQAVRLMKITESLVSF